MLRAVALDLARAILCDLITLCRVAMAGPSQNRQASAQVFDHEIEVDAAVP
jgi:hypothetical protein